MSESSSSCDDAVMTQSERRKERIKKKGLKLTLGDVKSYVMMRKKKPLKKKSSLVSKGYANSASQAGQIESVARAFIAKDIEISGDESDDEPWARYATSKLKKKDGSKMSEVIAAFGGTSVPDWSVFWPGVDE